MATPRSIPASIRSVGSRRSFCQAQHHTWPCLRNSPLHATWSPIQRRVRDLARFCTLHRPDTWLKLPRSRPFAKRLASNFVRRPFLPMHLAALLPWYRFRSMPESESWSNGRNYCKVGCQWLRHRRKRAVFELFLGCFSFVHMPVPILQTEIDNQVQQVKDIGKTITLDSFCSRLRDVERLTRRRSWRGQTEARALSGKQVSGNKCFLGMSNNNLTKEHLMICYIQLRNVHLSIVFFLIDQIRQKVKVMI